MEGVFKTSFSIIIIKWFYQWKLKGGSVGAFFTMLLRICVTIPLSF